MPWKECHVMDERLRFVARLLAASNRDRACAEAARAELSYSGNRAQKPLKCRFAKERHEPDLRYFSNLIAACSSGNSSETIARQGRC